ncbi:MAG: hypothetical protein KBD44_01155 [Candidatus Pacebacteria bacterium]|jgi:uncharacterized integral membrane protein|nr:hypothetical protein [Candidatus Paceibacterota bacterium]
MEKIKKSFETTITSTLDSIDSTVVEATKKIDTLVSPTRSTFAKRYPTLFSLLATLGVIMTFLGIEQILLTADILERHPMLILALGVAILALTGTLYKKLS